jgi:hypothetical protein
VYKKFAPPAYAHFTGGGFLLFISFIILSQLNTPENSSNKLYFAAVFGFMGIAIMAAYFKDYRCFIFDNEGFSEQTYSGKIITDIKYADIEGVATKRTGYIENTYSTIQTEINRENLFIALKNGEHYILDISRIMESDELRQLLYQKTTA